MKHQRAYKCKPLNRAPDIDGAEIEITVHLCPLTIDPPWPPCDREVLWAEALGNGRYQVNSIPFFAKGLSRCDVVSTHSDSNSILTYDGVISRGGHSTYRFVVYEGLSSEQISARESCLTTLSELGCSFEAGSPHFVAVDVPPSSNTAAVYDVLELGFELGVWDFDEGHFEPRSD
jgi:hypothetical protein